MPQSKGVKPWLRRRASPVLAPPAAANPELGARRALVLQALIFALLHPWYRAPGLEAVGLLGGLILLGLVLALQRRADAGSLWGAIGLHGGLVGGWFLVQKGLLQISPASPGWLVGPGGADINPIGGLIGWIGLGALLWIRRRWWSKNGASASP